MITGTDVISAVAIKIGNHISPTPAIYKKQIEQNVIKPNFFIKCLSTEQERIGMNWWKRTYYILVEYHPKETTNKFIECNEAAEVLLDCLDTIDLVRDIPPATPLRVVSSELEYKIRDEVLLFYATYSFKVEREVAPINKMKTLDTHYTIKGVN